MEVRRKKSPPLIALASPSHQSHHPADIINLPDSFPNAREKTEKIKNFCPLRSFQVLIEIIHSGSRPQFCDIQRQTALPSSCSAPFDGRGRRISDSDQLFRS